MSQVIFKTTIATKTGSRNVEVMAGWDRPLRHYFATVFDMEATDEDPETVWSTLEDSSDADSRGTARIRAKLTYLGIQVPEGFWGLVHKQEGNVRHVLPETTALTEAGRDIAMAMEGWDALMTTAREQFPDASEDELYETVRDVMIRTLGLK